MIVPTFLAVTFLSFILIRLVPGDPIEVRSGEHAVSAERLAEFRHQFGLDQPLWKQFLDYIGQLLQGGLGRSFVTQASVWTEFKTFFPATIELAACALVFARTTFLSDNRADLPRLTVPTLFIEPAHDTLAPREVGGYVHEHIAGSTLVTLNATGHCPHLSAPDETAELIAAFADQV